MATVNMKEGRYVQIDDKFAEKLVYYEHGDEKGGFQRKINQRRVNEMAGKLGNGYICPPIVVAEVEGKLYVMDGQHRLEAWKREKFPLAAVVHRMPSLEEAAKNFVQINRSAKKVSMSHVFKVDPSEYAQNVRNISEKYKLDIASVIHCLSGFGNRNAVVNGEGPIEDFEKVDRMLAVWSKDKRWTGDTGIFKKPGTLKMVAQILKTQTNIESAVTSIKPMDFSIAGTLSKRYGVTDESTRRMKEIVYKHIANQVL